MISVLCKSDCYLHLAPTAADNRGMGVSAFTLCLEKWTKREPCREDSIICPACLEELKRKGLVQIHEFEYNKGAQQ